MKREFLARLVYFAAGVAAAAVFFLFRPSVSRDAASAASPSADPAPPAAPAEALVSPAATPAARHHPDAWEAGRACAAAGGGAWRERMENLPSQDDRHAFLAGLCEDIAPGRIAGLAEQVAMLPAGSARELGVGILAERLAAADPRRALELARAHLSGPARNNAVSAVAETWGRNALPDLLGWVAAAPADPNVAQILEMGVVGAARANPQAAASLLLGGTSRLDAEQVALARNALLGIWALSDPASAVGVGRRILSETGASQPLQTAFLNWAANNPAAAAAATISPDAGLNQFAPEVASSWAVHSPAEASRWAASLAPNFVPRTEVMRRVAGAWAQTDASGAMSWASTLPRNDADRLATMREIAGSWSRFDEAGLEKFRNAAPPDVRADIDAARQSGP